MSRSLIIVSQCRRQIHSSLTPEVRVRTRSTPRYGLLHAGPQRGVFAAVAKPAISSFHSTPRKQGAPLIPFLLGALKVGASFLASMVPAI
jgi:hypothetical protein